MTLQEFTWVISIISFFGGIVIFLFKKIVIEPLQKSINSLNDTLREFKIGTDKRLDMGEKEIELLKLTQTRHEEQIKTLFARSSKGSA